MSRIDCGELYHAFGPSTENALVSMMVLGAPLSPSVAERRCTRPSSLDTAWGDHIGHITRSSSSDDSMHHNREFVSDAEAAVQLSLRIADVITWSKTDYETCWCIHHSAQRG